MTIFHRSASLPPLLEKVNALCDLLRKGKKEYEHIAACAPDRAMSHTFLTLAQRRNQYAGELTAHLHILGVKAKAEADQEPKVANRHVRDLKAMLLFCRLRERKILSAYRRLLKQSSISKGMQRMIRYQLEGMQCAFKQVRLLSSVGIR